MKPAHTPNCPGGTCDDPETAFLCDVCGRECAACFGVSESETCDDCEGKMETDIRYYCYDNECGFEEYDTEEQAKSAAEETLSCIDEFSDDTAVEYGVLIPIGVMHETNRRDTPEDTEEAARWNKFGWEYVSDHELVTVRTLNQHMANEFMRLRRERDESQTTANDLRAKLDGERKQIEVTIGEVGDFTGVRIIGSPRDVAEQLTREVNALSEQLANAQQTIAQLRQLDTVRPTVCQGCGYVPCECENEHHS